MVTPQASPSDVPPRRTEWFEAARFGMFVHWGLYALLGRGEWVMNRERIPLAEYTPLAERFTASRYDPRAWAGLAADAGMKYVVLTAKHHEGFCLWDSKVCPFNAARSGARRDLLAEYVRAVRDAGLKVGVYYSLGDWYHPDWSAGWRGDAAARGRFVEYTHALVHELMTGYGPIDLLFYDLPQCYSAGEWRSVELNAMVRRLQPQILINNRAMTTEDYTTPEQHARASAPGRMWECCMTLNDSWGYCPADDNFKPAREVVRTLAGIASGAGNLLLNVGPDPDGAIPGPSVQILRRVGEWLKVHGESIYASQRHRVTWNLWGPTTARGATLYLHLERYFGETLTIGGLANRVLGATLLTTGTTLKVRQEPDRTRLTGLPAVAPDDCLPVVKLLLDGPPVLDNSTVIGGADIFPKLPD